MAPAAINLPLALTLLITCIAQQNHQGKLQSEISKESIAVEALARWIAENEGILYYFVWMGGSGRQLQPQNRVSRSRSLRVLYYYKIERTLVIEQSTETMISK